MIENVTVTINNKKINVSKGTSLYEIAQQFQEEYDLPIILAKVNNQYKELSSPINKDASIELLTIKDKEANRSYVNGLLYLLAYAAKKVLRGNKLVFKHSLDKGIYISSSHKISKDQVNLLKNEMLEVAKLNLPIEKMNVNRIDAIEYFESVGDKSKVNLLKYNTNTFITLYKLGNMYNFFFSLMPINTSSLDRFDLAYIDENGFVLLYQTVYMEDSIKHYQHHSMLFDVFNEYHEWASIMNIELVPALNNYVSSGNIGDLIRISETVQSNNLLNIARNIYDNKDKIKVVLMAGPSSSGKTTTCNKLCMYLRSFGMNPKTISMDNYFVAREDTPKDKNGNYDFECLGALDLKLFDKQIADIINGNEVATPIYDFVSGKPRYNAGDVIKLDKKDVLIIEGIHALNPKILSDISRKKKYKIYISPLTCLNLDDQNRISTSDNRLLRRIIRDNRHRGNDVNYSLKKWASVRLGEEKNIFPFQDEADVIFNSSLIYEIGVLKTYVEPLLYSVDMDSPYYEEAKRLINMLKMFLPIPSDDIPKDSILREFIGGGCFRQ